MILLIDCLCRNLKWMWIDYFFSISAQTERRIWKSVRLWPSPQIWEILQNWWTLMVRCFPDMLLFFVVFLHLCDTSGFLHVDMLTSEWLLVFLLCERMSINVLLQWWLMLDCLCFVLQEKSFVNHQTTSWIHFQELYAGETINTLWIMKKCCWEVVYSETLSGALDWLSLLVGLLFWCILSPHLLAMSLYFTSFSPKQAHVAVM